MNGRGLEGSGKEGAEMTGGLSVSVGLPLGNIWYVLAISALCGLQKAAFSRSHCLLCLGLDKG